MLYYSLQEGATLLQHRLLGAKLPLFVRISSDLAGLIYREPTRTGSAPTYIPLSDIRYAITFTANKLQTAGTIKATTYMQSRAQCCKQLNISYIMYIHLLLASYLYTQSCGEDWLSYKCNTSAAAGYRQTNEVRCFNIH
jgi:hypothetical protein